VILFYRFIFPFIALLAAPYFILRMFRRGGYGFKFHYRLGLFPLLGKKGKNAIRVWIQAVSVGELSSLSKILDTLCQDQNMEIILTGTTSTGLKMAEQKYSDKVLAQGPFPLDWWLFSCLAWSRVQPDLIITVDSELWPEHFYQAKRRGVPALVINARLSDRTFQRLSGSPLARKLLLPKGLEILTTSERQRARWLEIGVEEKHIQIVGNLKVDAVDATVEQDKKPEELKASLGFEKDSLVLAGISTWPGEEELLIEAMSQIRKHNIDARLLLIPRHAERRRSIGAMLQQTKFAYHVRTTSHQAPQDTLVYLADTTGELFKLIHCADLALGGKTFPPNQGGQNPIEPIALGIPLILGPNYQNFRQTCSDLLVHDAIRTTENEEEAITALVELALNPEGRNQLRSSALGWIQSQGFPSEQTLEKIYHLLR
jgi:3-deoxy-D-manno-octulosonic-acid transferase